MKNKSGRHKETNTFKFQFFAERIANIDVDIFHRVGHENEDSTDETGKSYFYECVLKWNVLNLTEGYNNFRREVGGIVTLPQVLLHKDQIVEALLKHLKLQNSLSLQPLLECVVAVAKDLCKEFYPYYKQFLNQLIEILKTKDTEVLEWTFHCLAYLCKFLWRYIIKDITNVLNSLLPLLDSNCPEYVNNFAAESFAFVARKVRDRKSFLVLILKLLKQNPEAIPGCGRLLFEVTKGVAGQFHSCASELLHFYFESLSDEKCSQRILFPLLESFVNNVLQNISPKKIEPFWNAIELTLDQFLKQYNCVQSERSLRNIEFILRLIGQSIEYRDGKMVSNTQIIQKLSLILTQINYKEIQEIVSKIGALVLLYPQLNLAQEMTSKLINQILKITSTEIVFPFITNVIEAPSFEMLVLPKFLEYVVTERLNSQILKMLTQIVLKKSPPRLNGSLPSMQYSIDFPISKQIQFDYDINQNFLDLLDPKVLTDDLICTLICISHIKSLNQEKVGDHLIELVKVLNVKDSKDLFILGLVVDALSRCEQVEKINETLKMLLKPLLSLVSDTNILVLRGLDLTLSSCNSELLSTEILDQLNEVLINQVSSPFHEVRFLTTHIYSLFEHLPELNQIKTETNETWKIFSIANNIEAIEPNVDTYRQQLMYLTHLNPDKPQSQLFKESNFKTFPLRVGFGVMHSNFKLLWKPCIELIVSFAHSLEVEVFWDVFLTKLSSINQYIAIGYESNTNADFGNELLQTLFSDFIKLSEKEPDFLKYRTMLWNCMAEFPDIAHMKNRDLIPIFLEFIEKEYLLSNAEFAKTWNVQKNSITSENMEESDDEDSDEGTKKMGVKGKPAVLQTSVLACLEVFSKISNPKNMHRGPELYKIYLEFLMNKNSAIQKASLDCIMTYKHKYLTPYKEHLYNLIEEKQLKNELTLFRIDTDSDVVLSQHRPDLLPIILRIVYSKMVMKTGMRTGGKAGGHNRRSLVLRFLAGCQESEILFFVEMAFKSLKPYLEKDPTNIEIDLKNMIPPKKLQSILNLLEIVLENFGAVKSEKLLPYLLKLLFIIGGIVKTVFEQLEFLHDGYLSCFKALRTGCIQITTRFFEHFEKYDWTKSEIGVVFKLTVWPMLEKLPTEGIHSPTALMKLFMVWARNPRYFPLLANPYNNTNPLGYVLKLLVNSKSHSSVIVAILEILEHLLTLQPSEEEISVPQIPVPKPILNIDLLKKLNLKERLNFGSIILLDHTNTILEYLHNKVAGKYKGVTKKELLILSRVSELIDGVESCESLLKLLIPIIVKKCSAPGTDEEVVTQFIITLNNLVQRVPNPKQYLRSISPLFSCIKSITARKLIIDFVKFVDVDSTKLIVDLNAWDSKWVEQPDFNTRLDAFKEINKTIDSDIIQSPEIGILIVHNCFYTIRNETDLALRESAIDCLKKITPYLTKKYKSPTKDFIINDTLLTLIRGGIRDNNDKYRSESISLLGHMARECPENNILQDLNKLSDSNLEVDFFENLIHLQLHRHVRALLRLGSVAKTLTKPFNPRTLTQFILPLVSQYLCNEKYVSKNSIVDASIEAVGYVCRMLPWHHYETVLRYYLNKLRHNIEYQKQLIRLIVTILDAFHYDLSRAETNKIEEKPDESTNKMEEKKDESSKIDESTKNIENLDQLLDDNLVEDEVVEESEGTIFDKLTILAPSAAKRLIHSITIGILPQLNRSITQMTINDHSHKLNKKRTGYEKEEEDILRVPISLALVKLLQKLPLHILERNLSGIFMKICTFLRSHLESVRRITREILEKIMLSLGPKYLDLLLDEITPLMTRGFQVHVLIFTLHGVLNTLKPQFKPGDVDQTLQKILHLCMSDIFGVVADEKEVNNIVSKTSEAKSTKSYDTFQILAQFVTEKCFLDLILPLKEILSKTFTYKKVKKVEECLRKIVLGFMDNKFVEVDTLVIFAFATSSESIPELRPVDNNLKSNKKEAVKVDCFMIPSAPKSRYGEVLTGVKQAVNSNAHILVEFGLRLCYFLLKRERLREVDYHQFMDPFVGVLLDCLSSRYVKLSTLSMNCLAWIFKMDLPSLKIKINEFSKVIFDLLHKYAAAGLSKGDNFDLVMAAFKAMAVLVRDVSYYQITEDQFRTLLLYVEQDLHDHDRQATAFSLLKAIISRKLIVKEMHDVMDTVARLSITSEMPHVRLQSRQIFHQFLMDYPLGKRLQKHIVFYLSQLSFEMEYGRESALEMVQGLIQAFPFEILRDLSPIFFTTLGTRLVNDESVNCRKSVGKCITTMLERLERKDRDTFMDIIFAWFEDTEVLHRRFAAQLCGFIITVEKEQFESRLKQVMPVLLNQFNPAVVDADAPGRFVRLNPEFESDNERIDDHHLVQVLFVFLKLCTTCPKMFKMPEIESFALHAQSLLAHPHQWVRLSATQIINHILKNGPKPTEIVDLYIKNKSEEGYLVSDPRSGIKSLILDLVAQLQVDNVDEQLVSEVIKNLTFLVKVVKDLNNGISLLWMVKRMRKVIFAEIAQTPTVYTLREGVFRWISEVIKMLNKDQFEPVAHHLMAPLVREVGISETPPKLLQLTKQVLSQLKDALADAYTKSLQNIEFKTTAKRANRKRARLEMAVTDPEIAAKRKIKAHEKKKLAKKRKIQTYKQNGSSGKKKRRNDDEAY